MNIQIAFLHNDIRQQLQMCTVSNHKNDNRNN